MPIEDYLEKIQQDESIFPIDSPQRSIQTYPDRNRKRKKLKVTEQKKSPRRIMVDFDRTIHKYSEGWKDGSIYDPPFEGAKEGIEWLRDQGYEIVIFTARVSKTENNDHREQTKAVEEYLNRYGIHYDDITAEKYAAEFYIDDRAVYIPNGNWDVVLNEIQRRLSSATDE